MPTADVEADLVLVRRALLPVLAAAALAAAAGCSGADAQEAQALLTQSNAAFADVRSATFSATVSTSGAREDFSLTLSGGGYANGKHVGDFYVVVTADDMPFGEVVAVQRNGRVSMSADGVPIGSFAAPEASDNPAELVDFAQYVTGVSVEHGKLIDGESMAKLSGTIDTKGLLEGSLGSLGEIAQAGGGDLDLSSVFGDTRVVLYISESTHLPMRGLIDIPMKVAGEGFELHMAFAYTSFDEPLEFPALQ